MSSTGEDPGGSGLAAGANYFGALTNQQRQTAAYNAIAATHGPVEAYGLVDPQGALGAQEYGQREQTNPIAVKQDTANLAQTTLANQQAQSEALRNAQVRALYMIKSTVNPQTGAADPTAVDNLVGKNAAALGFTDPAQYQTFRDSITAPGGAGQIDQHIQGLLAPQQIMGARPIVYGKDGQAYQVQSTKTGQTAMVPLGSVEQASVVNSQANLPVKQENAATARAREGVYAATAPVTAAAAQYNAAGRNANQNYENPLGNAPGVRPVGTVAGDNRPSANFSGGNVLPQPSTDLIHAGNPPGSVTVPQVPQLTGKPLATRSAQAQTIANADTNFGTAKQVIDQLNQQATSYNTGAGSWLDFMRGGPQANLRANTAALRGQVGNAIISSMKNAQGQMGFRMTQAEFKTLTDSLGALGTEQSAAQFKQHLGYVQNALNNFNQTMHGNFSTQYGTDPYSALGIQKPGSTTGGAAPNPQDIVNELRRRGVVK